MNVAQRHGHKNINRTANYIHLTEQYYQQDPISWIINVLRSGMRGKRNLAFIKLRANQYKLENRCIDQNSSCKRVRTWRDSNPRPLA